MDFIEYPPSSFSTERYALLGKLAASSAHDLNNLLTIIQIHAANLEDESLSRTDSVEAGRQIGLTCRRGADLVRRILLFSKGRDDLMEDVALDDLLADVIALVEPLTRTSHKIELEVLGEPEFILRGNAGGLGQIFLNLLINAAESPAKSGTITVRCERVDHPPDCPEMSHAIRVSVMDHGGGIATDIQPKVFDAGFTTKASGSGMGLAIVKEWVEKHQGKIVIHSTDGKGTEMCVYFPLSPVPGDTGGLGAGQNFSMLAPLVLVVEDDAVIRSLGAQILIRADFRVLEAGNASEALLLWEAHKDEISLLFTDIVLSPDMSGTQLAERLRRERPELKIIFTSGYFAPDGLDDPVSDGNFLAKPYHPHKLIEMAKLACGRDRRVARDRVQLSPR